MLAALVLALAPAAIGSWPGEDEIPAVAYPALLERSETPEGFVPTGWKLDKLASGDLNGDGRADLALVLQKTDPANLVKRWAGDDARFDTNPRVLLVAFCNRDEGFTRVATDYRLISRLTNGNMDDPFASIAIHKGVLRVGLQVFMNAGGWWAGSYAFRFRWQGRDFRLIGYDRSGIKRNTLEADGLSINYLTGDRIVSGSGPEESKPWSKRQRVARMPLIKLGEIGDGLEFEVR
jgi:hypothetical protein